MESVHLLPILPLGFGSLDAPCPSQEVPHSPSRQGSWTRRAGEEPVTLCSFPGMRKQECSWAQSRALEQGGLEHPLSLTLPEPCCPHRGPMGKGTRWQSWPGLPRSPGTSESVQSHTHKFPHTLYTAAVQMHAHENLSHTPLTRPHPHLHLYTGKAQVLRSRPVCTHSRREQVIPS